MSDTTASLRRKIESARQLRSVVRTMKALAASSIGQYEQSVRALADYYRTVELGLIACLRGTAPPSTNPDLPGRMNPVILSAVVFGSDQGLVGRFNETIAQFAASAIAGNKGGFQVWAVGDRVHSRLEDVGIPPIGFFPVPNSVKSISPLIGQILLETEKRRGQDEVVELHLYYNRLTTGSSYEPVTQRLLPLDETWRRSLAAHPWPTASLPEAMGTGSLTLRALIREYLFVSLYRACADSLASENASRLSAMQRAEKNIDELLDNLKRSFYGLRQRRIDEELFDVISGFEALLEP